MFNRMFLLTGSWHKLGIIGLFQILGQFDFLELYLKATNLFTRRRRTMGSASFKQHFLITFLVEMHSGSRVRTVIRLIFPTPNFTILMGQTVNSSLAVSRFSFPWKGFFVHGAVVPVEQNESQLLAQWNLIGALSWKYSTVYTTSLLEG